MSAAELSQFKEAGVLRVPKSRRYPEHPFGHAWHREGNFAAGVNRDDGLEWLKETED